MNMLISLLALIKGKRVELELCQSDLAAVLNISTDAYRKIENGVNPLSVGRLLTICEVLQIDLGDFFGDALNRSCSNGILRLKYEKCKADVIYLKEEVWFLREMNHNLVSQFKEINQHLLDPKQQGDIFRFSEGRGFKQPLD